MKLSECLAVVAHSFNQEAEAGGSVLSLRAVWSTKWVIGQLGLYNETCLKKQKDIKE